MKKLIALGLSLVMAASLFTGCGTAKESVKAKVIEIELTQEEYAFGVDKTQPELLEKTNAFIAEIKANGTFDEKAQAEAKERALSIINSQLTEELVAYIKDNYGDVQAWLSNKIESVIYTLKATNKIAVKKDQ